MKATTMLKLLSVVSLAMLILAPVAQAQGMRWRGGGGWGPGTAYGRIYDTKAIETVTGEVVKIDHFTPMRGMSTGVHLILKTATGEMSVHLGPQWYLENQDVKIEPKDKVEIKGSRVTVDGKPALIAAEIKKGDGVLKLRDEAGVPMWAGWRRG
jgi:hypothetical protein